MSALVVSGLKKKRQRLTKDMQECKHIVERLDTEVRNPGCHDPDI